MAGRAARTVICLLAAASLLFSAPSSLAQDRDDRPREETPSGPPARRQLKHTQHTFEHGGVERRYGLYVPARVAAEAKRVPAVFVLHGATGDADRAERYLGFNEVAEAERFIVVYPEGLKGSWDDGRPDILRWRRRQMAADDIGFLDALAAHLAEALPVDAARVYLAGMSNGGFMTTRVACENPLRFAAFAPMLSSLPAAQAERCRPQRAIPVLMIAGTGDRLVQWRGFEKGGQRIMPVLDQARFWADHNGCGKASEQRLNDVDPHDGSTLIWASWSACRRGGAVELYAIEGGGHQLPSMRRSVSDFLVGAFLGARNRDMETAEVVWQFFKRHRLPDR